MAVFPADSSRDWARMNPKNRIGSVGGPGTSTSVLVWESRLSPGPVISFILCFFACPHGIVALFALQMSENSLFLAEDYFP